MLPVPSFYNIADSRPVNEKLAPKAAIRFSACGVSSSYFSDLRFRQFGVAVIFTFSGAFRIGVHWIEVAPLVGFVLSVIRRRSLKQMVRANARRIVAAMAYRQSFFDLTEDDCVHNAMHEKASIAKPDAPVPGLLVGRACPFPAFTSNGDMSGQTSYQAIKLWFELSAGKMFSKHRSLRNRLTYVGPLGVSERLAA